jgi:GTP-binding protein
VGKTPGATASVNLYALYDKKEKPILGFVDLPGFGYARLSKDVQESVQRTAERYLSQRGELVLGILLVDIRRLPSEDDRIVLAALYDLGVPIVIVATKVDKISKTELETQLEENRQKLGLPEGQPFFVSSVTGEGIKALWSLILEACEQGVQEFCKKLERSNSDDDHVASRAVDQTQGDSVHGQGYDWINSEEIIYEDEDYEGYDEDDSTVSNEVRMQPEQRETLKSLKKKARRMERGGEV